MNEFRFAENMSNPCVGGVSDADFAPQFRRDCRVLGRQAFTLVELLVVIAIIGILVSLLLPAIQAAREAARRTQCVNNVTEIGLAVHNYEFQFEALPPGVTDDKGPIRSEPIGKHVSWIVKILPYMEELPLSRRFDQAAGAYAAANAPVRAAQIMPLECPSEPREFLNEVSAGATVAESSYAGCHHDVEAPIDADNHGLLYLNSQVRFADIFDGSSKTILLGEILLNKDGLGWVSGTRATLRSTSTINNPRPSFTLPAQSGQGDGAADKQGPLFVGGFGSFHPGSANFGFADGSTHTIAQSIDPAVFRLLGNRADGEIVPAY
ncbi:MAG TPA: DUF1559 domain-containing protein [Lacipirellulaceae bacterium]|jgi:prepilin-type N-terminal cleavage/methylation domain-containing protein/prepilin-type processing-associated H-X9-DG protein